MNNSRNLLKIIIILLSLLVSSNIYAQKRPYIKDKQALRFSWDLVYSEEFRKNGTIDENWIPQNGAENSILSSRWRENLRIRYGKLILSNKKENRGGKEWTSANLISKRKFQYGYFECRMRISRASGINNSFWFSCYEQSNDKPAFEIDAVEGHYPNIVNCGIHNWGTLVNKNHSSIGEQYVSDVDLAKRYHIYGLYWDENELRFYFDGKLIWSHRNEYCFGYAHILLSTAVLGWAGEITEAIDGTDMRVDYVRVWTKKNQ